MTENELIYLCKYENVCTARDILIAKYERILMAITFKIGRSMFPKYLLENADFMSYTYLSLLRCIKNFNLKQKRYTFKQAVIITNKSDIIRTGSKLFTNGERILNNYNELNNQEYQSGFYENFNDQIMLDLFCEKLARFKKGYILVAILKLKINNYKDFEIASKLKITASQVNNFYMRIKKLYNDCEL